MTQCPTYTGDVQLRINENGDWDIYYDNGQPCMTDGFDTEVILAVFIEPDTWQNALTNNPEEQYISDFPDVVKNGTVDNDTINDGIAAIKRALQYKIDNGSADTIDVTGIALSIYAIEWEIIITRGSEENRYDINRKKGVIKVSASKVAA